MYKMDYPDISVDVKPINRDTEIDLNDIDLVRQYQNIHLLLGWYKPDLETGRFSYDQFRSLLPPENEEQHIVVE